MRIDRILTVIAITGMAAAMLILCAGLTLLNNAYEIVLQQQTDLDQERSELMRDRVELERALRELQVDAGTVADQLDLATWARERAALEEARWTEAHQKQEKH